MQHAAIPADATFLRHADGLQGAHAVESTLTRPLIESTLTRPTIESTLTRPVAPPAPGWAALGTWFDAPTPHGPLRLYVGEAAGPSPHAAGAALALQRCGELLDALDDWLGESVPWRWSGPPDRMATGAAQVRVAWRGSCHQLIAPWRWLRALPPPPQALAARLQWPAHDAVLGVSQLRLDADAVQQLEAGGAVLLPASMKPEWTGGLRAAVEGPDDGVALSLRDPAAPCFAPGVVVPTDVHGAAAGRRCEVRLTLQHALPADCLAGWQTAPLAAALAPGMAATLWQHAAAREPSRCLAHGRLMPWGDGWALALQQVEAQAVAPGARSAAA